MKYKSIYLIFFCLSLCSCKTIVAFNLKPGIENNQKAILLLQTHGDELIGTRNLVIKSINGQKITHAYSKKRLEFKPGLYEIEFSIIGSAGLIGGMAAGIAGGNAAITTYLHGEKRELNQDNIQKFQFLADRIYLASFKIDKNEKVTITVEEV